MYDYVMLFTDENDNGELYKYFFKNVWYKVYNTDGALIIKIENGFNDSETEIIKMICKLKWAKAKEDDWGLLLNSDAVKEI